MSFTQKMIVGAYNYQISGVLISNNTWNIHVRIIDKYDFDTRRELVSFSSFANNIGYRLTQIGLVDGYDWSVEYWYDFKNIW